MRRLQLFSIVVFGIAVASFVVFHFGAVVVSDPNGPVITMEENQITVSVGAEDGELLAGITAVDDKDGDVTDSLLVESLSNFIAENTRLLTFAASDSDGHIVKGSREIIYNDYQPPRFSLDGPLAFAMGTEDVLTGLHAEDVLDGDLSSKIKASSADGSLLDQPGEYQMEFSVSNSAGDVSRLPVTVTIYAPAEELARPQIALSDYLVYTQTGTELDPWDYVESLTLGNTVFTRSGDRLQSEDGGEYDGKTSLEEDDFSIQESVEYETPGTYEITYQFVTQTYGTGTVRLVVVVCD